MVCKDLDVLVLTYNRADYLRIMLESLCVQTATGFNIIVLNNASTDNTLEVIEEFRKKYPTRNISVVTNKKNLGNVGNFKRSQEIAKNVYTAVFHDDDAIHPEYIETAMKIFKKHPEIGYCCGNVNPLWNVSNDNWEMLYKDYYIYPKGRGVFFELRLNRLNFPASIYKTDIYKKVVYHNERYGKLHDIVFLGEVNQLAPSAIILGVCARWRQSAVNDSNIFTNGPFPNEVENTISRLSELSSDCGQLIRVALWNFAFFLYNWSELKRYETWKEFTERLICNEEGKSAFSRWERRLFTNKWGIRFLNKILVKKSAVLGRQVYNKFDSRS